LTNRLNRREQKANQDHDDGHYNQRFDQGHPGNGYRLLANRLTAIGYRLTASGKPKADWPVAVLSTVNFHRLLLYQSSPTSASRARRCSKSQTETEPFALDQAISLPSRLKAGGKEGVVSTPSTILGEASPR
jgi:hypothetical protein